jgi:hypothetical protein
LVGRCKTIVGWVSIQLRVNASFGKLWASVGLAAFAAYTIGFAYIIRFAAFFNISWYWYCYWFVILHTISQLHYDNKAQKYDHKLPHFSVLEGFIELPKI